MKNKTSVIAEESKKSDFLRKNFNTVNDELDQQSRKYKSLASRKSRIENDIKQMEEDIAQQADGNQIQKLKAENEMKLTNFTERKNEIEDIIDNLRRDVEVIIIVVLSCALYSINISFPPPDVGEHNRTNS